MSECAILVKDLKIRYKSANSYSVKKGLFKGRKEKNEYYEAVKGISFSVQKGEILGIIGRNGCGKSTMLRAIGGIYSPDEGIIETFDNSVALMAIGVGFQKELTGRENILLSGSLLGVNEETMLKYMDDIIEFSELGSFIDMPVRTYSSGMHSKLAFSITSVLEPDIMLLDEVLSVGDQAFRKKSLNRMKQLISRKDRTVVIVSHSISTLLELCDKVLWMHEGRMVKIGEPREVLKQYKEFMEGLKANAK
ncbi:MAG: ABC transporter ATP-binding protein [Agathobacter sp.]|nr:ABC transporter ATP-binding protein [Agathobacter sp.]